MLGALLAGGTVALCNPAYKPSELAHQLRMTRARLILCTSIVYSNAQRAASIAASHAEDEEAKDVEGLEPLEDAPGVYTFEERHESSWHELLKMGEEAGEEGRKAVEAVRISPQEDTAILCFR